MGFGGPKDLSQETVPWSTCTMGEQKENVCADAAAVYWIFSCSAQPLRYTRINAEQLGSWSWGEVSLIMKVLGGHSQCSQESLGSSPQVSV